MTAAAAAPPPAPVPASPGLPGAAQPRQVGGAGAVWCPADQLAELAAALIRDADAAAAEGPA